MYNDNILKSKKQKFTFCKKKNKPKTRLTNCEKELTVYRETN